MDPLLNPVSYTTTQSLLIFISGWQLEYLKIIEIPVTIWQITAFSPVFRA